MKIKTVILRFPILILLFICFQFNEIFAQEFINGKIFNSETNETIPFVAIQLKTSKMGVISNSNGDFRLSLNTDFQSDSVVISCIGYNHKSIAYSDLQLDKVNNVYLIPAVYEIKEVFNK